MTLQVWQSRALAVSVFIFCLIVMSRHFWALVCFQLKEKYKRIMQTVSSVIHFGPGRYLVLHNITETSNAP